MATRPRPLSRPSESLPQSPTYPYSSHDDLFDSETPYSSSSSLLDEHFIHSSPNNPFDDDLLPESRTNTSLHESGRRDTLFTRIWRTILELLPDLLPKGLGFDAIQEVVEYLYNWLVDLFRCANPDAAPDAMEPPQALGGTHRAPNMNGMSHVAEKYQVQATQIARKTAGGGGSTGISPGTERRVPAPARRATAAGGVPESVPRQGGSSDRSMNAPIRKSRSSSRSSPRR